MRKAVLSTDKVPGCPGLKTPALVVFYQSKEGYSGSDHVSYAVTNAAGQAQGYDVTISVKPAPAGVTPQLPKAADRKLAVRQGATACSLRRCGSGCVAADHLGNDFGRVQQSL